MNRRSLLPILSLATIPFLDRTIQAQNSAPLTYKANLTQSGESAPTADVFVNTLGCSVTWIYHEVGVYIGSFSAQFASSAKVFCYAPVRDNAGDVTTGTAVSFTMDGTCSSVMVCTYGEGEDGIIGRREVEGIVSVFFEIYPN